MLGKAAGHIISVLLQRMSLWHFYHQITFPALSVTQIKVLSLKKSYVSIQRLTLTSCPLKVRVYSGLSCFFCLLWNKQTVRRILGELLVKSMWPLTSLITTPFLLLLPPSPIRGEHLVPFCPLRPCAKLIYEVWKYLPTLLSHQPLPKIAKEASVEGPHFVVQKHNQVMSVLFRGRTGNLEPRGGYQQQAPSSTRTMFADWKMPFNDVPDIQMKKTWGRDGGSVAGTTNKALKTEIRNGMEGK